MKTVEVLVEKLAHAEGLPAYATPGSSGVDLRAAVKREVLIAAGGRALIPTGLRIALPEGFEAQIRARSGLALEHGLLILNAPGTIDSDYRGEVQVILGNLGHEPFTVSRGMRIAQMIVQEVPRITFVEVPSVPETKRSA